MSKKLNGLKIQPNSNQGRKPKGQTTEKVGPVGMATPSARVRLASIAPGKAPSVCFFFQSLQTKNSMRHRITRGIRGLLLFPFHDQEIEGFRTQCEEMVAEEPVASDRVAVARGTCSSPCKDGILKPKNADPRTRQPLRA